MLDAHPILINALDVHGRNALSVAGSGDAAEFLAAHGAVDPGTCRREAVEAFKRYLATGDVYRLVELVLFYEIDLVAVEHDLRRSNTTMFHCALPFPGVMGHLLDWTANERLDYAGPDTHAARAMLRGGSLASRLGARTKSERQSLIRSLELLESLYPSDFPADRVSPLTAALLQEA